MMTLETRVRWTITLCVRRCGSIDGGFFCRIERDGARVHETPLRIDRDAAMAEAKRWVEAKHHEVRMAMAGIGYIERTRRTTEGAEK